MLKLNRCIFQHVRPIATSSCISTKKPIKITIQSNKNVENKKGPQNSVKVGNPKKVQIREKSEQINVNYLSNDQVKELATFPDNVKKAILKFGTCKFSTHDKQTGNVAFQEPSDLKLKRKEARKHNIFVYNQETDQQFYWRVSVWVYNVPKNVTFRMMDLYLEKNFGIFIERANERKIERLSTEYFKIPVDYLKAPTNKLLHITELSTGPAAGRNNSVLTKEGNKDLCLELAVSIEKLREIITTDLLNFPDVKRSDKKFTVYFKEEGVNSLVPFTDHHNTIQMLQNHFDLNRNLKGTAYDIGV